MRVGITGHQDLGSPDDEAWVTEQLRLLIGDTTLTSGVTSLAIGADQLYARLLAAQGKPFTAIIPCRKYEQTFGSSSDIESYRSLLAQAAETISLSHDEPSEAAFWEAGKRVAEASGHMIAIWNGLPAKGLGGTGDVVRYCLGLGKRVVHLNPHTHSIEVLRQ